MAEEKDRAHYLPTFRESSRGVARDDAITYRHAYSQHSEKNCRISVLPIEQDPSGAHSVRASSPFRGAKTAQLISTILASPERRGGTA